MPENIVNFYVDIDEDSIIKYIYRNRCIMCRQEMAAIHELDYRSSGKDAMSLKRRVPLCEEHHTWAHDIVGKKVAIPILEKRQEEALRTWARDPSKHLTLMNTKKNVFTFGIQQEDL